jgi:hypothetical protein
LGQDLHFLLPSAKVEKHKVIHPAGAADCFLAVMQGMRYNEGGVDKITGNQQTEE